ncbi:MAG: hypothetical protein WB492_08900 [Christiangramia sp.]
MKINWFTLIAQVINFLILMWLLKRYLYKPILKAIDERENKILAQLNDAEAKKTEAKKERDEFAEKNETFNKQKEALMAKVIEESNTKAEKLKEQARTNASLLKAKLEKSLQEEQERHHLEISKKIQQEVMSIAKKTLVDLSSSGLEDQIVNTFIIHLKHLKEDNKKQLISALNTGNDQILIQSAYDFSKDQQASIKETLINFSDQERTFQFKTTPELIAGIELSTNGYKLSWSISEYIKSLQKNISEHIENSPENSS